MKTNNKAIEKSRVRCGPFASNASYGNNGVFQIPRRGHIFTVQASDGEGWDHISVSLPARCPTWQEMSWIKDLFWDDNETVIQYHPAKEDYVNNHPFCLYLWKWHVHEFPKPPTHLVGIKTKEAKHGTIPEHGQ